MKNFYVVLAVMAALGVGVLVYQMSKPAVSIPANVAVLPADTAGFRGYVLGADSAPVEIVEYGDYQCPGCANFALVTFPDIQERLINTGRVRFVYRDFPLDGIHRFARLSAHAAACADEQGRFWPMNKLIFQGQPDWASGGADRVIRGYAEAAALDMDQYDTCMESARYAGRIQASYEQGAALGVGGTPMFLIGGRLYNAMGYDEMRRLVDSIAAAPQQ
ncbi:MAG TPA: thioredoxin domain-containing protein [Gemmatimonadales bacterium]|nr:thioredoxin domain-containing protein [Gemmatimonadales bacterium]